MATVLQQLKTLLESRDLMQQELEELRDVKDVAQDMAGLVEIQKGNEDEPLTLVGRLRKKYPKASKGMSPQPPDSMWDMYLGW